MYKSDISIRIWIVYIIFEYLVKNWLSKGSLFFSVVSLYNYYIEKKRVRITSFNRKNSFIERLGNENYVSDDNRSNSEQRSRRSSLAAYPWMRFSFFNLNKCGNFGFKSESYVYFKKWIRQMSHPRMCGYQNYTGKPFL